MARNTIDKIVYLYNNERPHESIGNLTPAAARSTLLKPKKRWKNYWRLRQQAAGEESPSVKWTPKVGRFIRFICDESGIELDSFRLTGV